MKKLFLALALSTALASPVSAQHAVKICVEQNDGSCTPVKSGTPLPTTSSGGSGGTSNVPVGTAAFATSQATITTTSAAAALAARTGAVGTGRASVTIYNAGSVTAYIGTSTGVTTTTGIPILPGGNYTKFTTAAIFAVTAAGTTTLAFDEDF